MKYLLNCRPVNNTGIVLTQGHKEGLGYEYVDMVDEPTLPQGAAFEYGAVNNVTNFYVDKNTNYTVAVDFRDFYYMTNFKRFSTLVKDPEIIAGLKEGTLDVNLAEVMEADSGPNTKFEVAGRLFWEMHAFSQNLLTFSTNGFMDKEGYTEPLLDTESNKLQHFAILIVVLLIVSLVIYYFLQK